MARNMTSFAIMHFLRENNMTHAELAKRMRITPAMLSHRITKESFSDFEKKQLETIGVDFSVPIV